MADPHATSDSDGPIINDNVIRIQLRKPQHRKWELRTRNRSPGLVFPTIQLFDCDGNILLETNDDNVSIKSSDYHDPDIKHSKSLNEKDYRHFISKGALKKSNTVSGDSIYTRLFKKPECTSKNMNDIVGSGVINDETLKVVIPPRRNSDESILQSSEAYSDRDNSSYKSSDNESPPYKRIHSYATSNAGTLLISPDENLNSPFRRHRDSPEKVISTCDNNTSIEPVPKHLKTCLKPEKPLQEKVEAISNCLQKSKSLHNVLNHPATKQKLVRRSHTDVTLKSEPRVEYSTPNNKISFLDTYLKSLPNRTRCNPAWAKSNPDFTKIMPDNEMEPRVMFRDRPKTQPDERRYCQIWENKSDSDIFSVPSDIAAEQEMQRRLKKYRRGVTELDLSEDNVVCARTRPKSEGDDEPCVCSTSSESLDEADVILNRLRRRILKNKIREKRTTVDHHKCRTSRKKVPHKQHSTSSIPEDHVSPPPAVEECLPPSPDMGSNISHHSVKGLTGRRARSSGDLCNGDTKSQTDSSEYRVVEFFPWNRSLPNHLDGNRHLASEYNGMGPRNNNYGEIGGCQYHPKAGRGMRYQASKSGSGAEPVWKLQDPGCDQGYGSERSPEEDFGTAGRQQTYEEYEAQLQALYPFITGDNTFTVVVEKDGRGLGMSVSGGDEGGLVRIRRLYPPQPAWRTGRLAPRDLLLAANGVPLTGLTTYEALEVLRTTSPRVELRVCRPPADVLDCITPPAPPTPPVRHHPPADPLNCHPLHARLSATTSSATTSSSEGRYGAGSAADVQPDGASSPYRGGGEALDVARPDSLRLSGLDRPLPVYDVQYGEFDIIMTKVNGSLGFTLRKEDHSALGHYVRALVREPALSDGRIQAGDRIVAVNDVPMAGMSHVDAVAFLRSCGAEVRLRLYRDMAATPLEPLSPQESQERHSPSDSDTTTVRPKPHLRQEAVNMLCDLAARRLTPEAADGSRSPCLSPRKFRKLTRDNTGFSQGSDNQPYTVVCPTTTDTNSDSESSRPSSPLHLPCGPLRPHPLNLGGSPTLANCRKQKLSLTVAPHGYELNNLDNDVLDAPNIYQDTSQRHLAVNSHYLGTGNNFQSHTNEPISMPVELSSGENSHFSHNTPAYQSAVVHLSSNDNTAGNESHKDDGIGLKKWKGVTLSPEKERKMKPETKPRIVEPVQKENLKPQETEEVNKEPTILTVELNRGWNSRLGFSVQSHPESGQSYVSAIYSDSVAHRDGRLRRGDVILQVNDENVTNMKTPEVIDLLRILRGSICITVLRPNCQ